MTVAQLKRALELVADDNEVYIQLGMAEPVMLQFCEEIEKQGQIEIVVLSNEEV